MVEIRRLTSREVEEYEIELTRFMKIVLEENLDIDDVDSYAKDYYQKMKIFSQDGSAVLHGAFDGKRLVGFHWGYVINALGKKKMHSYFDAVEYEYRGQKIGSRFFDALEKVARERGIHEIEAMCSASNKIAVNYHLHNGFKIERYQLKKVLE